jgi:cytochrome c oxidase subunit 2
MNRRLLLGAAAGALLAAFSARSQEKVVRIRARKFAYSPSQVTLKKGVPVTLEFTTEDVAMGFNAPDLNLRADILPGQSSRLRFTPDRTGSFVFLCDIFCGDGHEKMSGQLKVVA